MSDSVLSKVGALAILVILIIISGFRWYRLLLHRRGLKAYRPTPRGKSPRDNDLQDIAVILPVVDHQSDNFIPTVKSILWNFPGQLYVVVVGRDAYDKVEPQMAALRKKYEHSQIHIGAVNKASRRRQIAHALGTINHRDFRLTVITEQGAYWPPRFLPSACYPFDDQYVSAVTVPKMAHLPLQGGIWAHVKAYLFSFHYCVQAEDNCVVNCLDCSALFGGPTTLVRTYVLKENRFKDEFEKEMWFHERFGPLTGGEHFFLNRYLLGGNKKIFFQDSPDATVSVEMNSICEFIGEFLRTTRDNWRTCYSIAPQCASLYYHHGHVIYPAATRMTWWPTIFSLATQIDLLTIVLVLNDNLLNKAAFCVFIIATFLMATAQAVLGLLVVRRMQRNNFDVIAPLSCALLSLSFQCALNLLKGVALLTFWKTDDESASQNIEVPGERNLPWSWDFNEGDWDRDMPFGGSWLLFKAKK
ncbi:hypothetical protein QX201_013103 [Fusarium graminearum]|nr:unnamed protein product [Fusarium graminearum]